MVTLAAIMPSLNPEDIFVALDLQDTYFHSTTHPAHKHFLQFVVSHEYHQYEVHSDCLLTAPQSRQEGPFCGGCSAETVKSGGLSLSRAMSTLQH